MHNDPTKQNEGRIIMKQRIISIMVVLSVLISSAPGAFALDGQTMETYSDVIPIVDEGTTRWELYTGGSKGFMESCGEDLAYLLRFIKSEFETIFGEDVVNSHPRLTVAHDAEEGPVTYRSLHSILLSSDDSYWLQHIYQFSHELCHFMISSDVCDNYRWFEESLCELMSWYILEQFNTKEPLFQLMQSYYPNYSAGELHQSLADYINRSIQKRKDLEGLSLSEFFRSNWDYLSEECYDRPVNAEIAYELYPLFLEYPVLWHIVPYMNQMNASESLEENLVHLSSLAQIPEADFDGLVEILCGDNNRGATGRFTDVAEADWFAEPVSWAVDEEITNGTTESTFSPQDTCTVAQILTFLWRACQKPEPNVMNPFPELSPDVYYYKAALWAFENGLIDSSNFKGSVPCTRAATVTYLWILSGKENTGSSTFHDVPAESELAQAVSWAVEYDVTNGTSISTFSPDQTCTRAEIVTFLWRAQRAGKLYSD